MKKTKLGIILLVVFTLLIWTNPTDAHFLGRIANDYGLAHGGVRLNHNDLLDMGSGKRYDYLICSKYEYSLGNISVIYFGIFRTIFYSGSVKPKPKTKNSLAFL